MQRLVGLLAIVSTVPAACRADDPRPVAAPVAATAAPVARPAPQPRGPFDPARLRCATLLPEPDARALLGFPPRLLERAMRSPNETVVVCSHRTQRASETFSFQVACGRNRAPDVYARLRRIHEKAAGARPSPVGREGLLTRTSLLFLHEARPCFVQVTGRGAAAAGLERLGERIASAVP